MEKLKEIYAALSELTNPSRMKYLEKTKQPQPYVGVMMGDIRKLAKKYAKRTDLALALWRGDLLDGQLLANFIAVPKELTSEQIEEILSQTSSDLVKEGFVDHVLSKRKDIGQWREKWMASPNLEDQAIAWGLLVREIIGRHLKRAELKEWLTYLENHLMEAPATLQKTMNRALVEIGVYYDDFTNQALAIGEKLGLYKDAVVAKGCTSPYAPEWITAALANRQARGLRAIASEE